MTTLGLDAPHLSEGLFSSITCFTDEALFSRTGVRIAFTTRDGGESKPPYDSLNLALHVQDDPDAVERNRARVLSALGGGEYPLIAPNQVHGDVLVQVDSPVRVDEARTAALEGADGILVASPGVATLLCFADCVPMILVGPNKTFSVVHCGWRGVDNGIAVKALIRLCRVDGCDAGEVNVYRGAYIHAECFETGPDVHERFVRQFGEGCAPDSRHVDLGRALDIALIREGVLPERIVDVDRCTVCDNERWYSYRAQDGVCGRHGAIAFCVGETG